MRDLRIVVGSGPSSIGVTHALLERGYDVTMLDVGEELDEDTQHLVAAMARREPDEWSQAERAAIQRADFNGDPALSPKRAFGSSYAYFTDSRINAPSSMRLYGSRAFGGLSTVWGCALLKPTPGDIDGWPAEVSGDLPAAYAKIGELVQRTIGVDIFEPDANPKISVAARTILERFNSAADARTRVDIYPTPLAIDRACKACNACMYGCVYGYTYSSRETIKRIFMKNPRFRYLSGVTVERYRETADGVEISALCGPEQRSKSFHARQLFLAAGMMGSLRIVWNSSAEVSRVLHVRDLSYFLIPGVFPVLAGNW